MRKPRASVPDKLEFAIRGCSLVVEESAVLVRQLLSRRHSSARGASSSFIARLTRTKAPVGWYLAHVCAFLRVSDCNPLKTQEGVFIF